MIVEGPSNWSEVENVDLSRYPETPPVSKELVHEVPEILMASAADDGAEEIVEGFRVQVFSSVDRQEAVNVEEELLRWARSLEEDDLQRLRLASTPDIISLYKQPYYRIRVGAFMTREAADGVYQALRRSYPSTLIVPDDILITR